jgi:hypothetical protein
MNGGRDKNHQFLDRIYPVPFGGPADERYFHADLDLMSNAVRQREFEQARTRLLLETRPHPWLIQRIEILARGLENAN